MMATAPMMVETIALAHHFDDGNSMLIIWHTSTMDISTLQFVAAVATAVAAGALPALQASRKAGRVENRLGEPNGSDDSRTIRELLTQIMRQVSTVDERLLAHDRRQMDNARRIGRVEQKLEDLTARLESSGFRAD